MRVERGTDGEGGWNLSHHKINSGRKRVEQKIVVPETIACENSENTQSTHYSIPK